MRQEAYSYFYTTFIFIVKALEIIVYGLHIDEISEMFTDVWNRSSKAGTP